MTKECANSGKISIVIPSYNSANTIKDCVESILACGYPQIEILVVDDVSNDASPQIVEVISNKYPQVVQLIRMSRNGGPARARNEGARQATGEFLFFMDSDTKLVNGSLDKFIDRIKDADAVSGLYHWEPINDAPCAWYKAMLNYHMFSRNGVFEYEVFNAAVAGIKAETFHEIGGFNEALEWGMDYELEEFGHRLIARHKHLLDPEIQVHHDFPLLRKATTTYFNRVTLWVELLMQKRGFESGGTATASTGVASAAVPAALLTLPLAFVWPWALLVTMVFFGLYLRGYGGFLGFVARKKLAFLPQAFVLNLYFCCVITAAAAFGALRSLTGTSKASLKVGQS